MKKNIGYSEIATLTIQFFGENGIEYYPLSFGADGAYICEICTGEAPEIRAHYHSVKKIKYYWLRVFDDNSKTFEHCAPTGAGEMLEIYRAGEKSCIFHFYEEN